MPFSPPEDSSLARRARLARWLGFVLALILLSLVIYLGYIGYVGSEQLAGAPDPSKDCRTPASLGWTYQAINYDQNSDADLLAFGNTRSCPHQGTAAASALTAADGTRIAGWYIPAAARIGPTGPTVVLAHGWRGNKSTMLDYAALLHPTYNLVIFDFRDSAQSSGTVTTQGALEQQDLLAVINWLERTQHPARLALLGVSMGGTTSVNVAAADERVDAVVLDSTQATLANAIEARLTQQGYPLAVPGAWSILLGGLIRTGQDMSAVDPQQAIARLGARPVLIIEGGADTSIGHKDGESLLEAAHAAGVDARLQVCGAATHAQSLKACGAAYRSWVLGFLTRSLGG